jgi:periplasmic divalent cation tolerance protein
MDTFIQVMTTTETKGEADRIAARLVEGKQAGCVQVIGPIVSTYQWEGAVERGEEWLCLIKTSRKLFPEVEKTITELHPYDVPEIIALPIVTGSAPYLAWLDGELKK